MPEDKTVDEEIEKVEEEIESAEDYFASMGLDSSVERNDFSADDAVKVFEKAIEDIKTRKENNRLMRSYVKYGWSILQTIIKLV